VTAHEAQIFPAHIYGFGTFRAVCACGWIGDDAFTEADARQQHHRHTLTAADADVWRIRLTALATHRTKEGALLLSGTAAAKALQVHPRTVRRWMSEGRFTPHENRLGDSLYLVSEVAAMMDPDREENTT